ncbi:twin-arginine translocase TatA/TatE family subunit [Bacteroidota bacterium]
MEAFVLLGMVGPWQIILLVVAIVFLFGGRKIPELMRGIGQGMKEFKKATKDEAGGDEEVDKKIEEGEA